MSNFSFQIDIMADVIGVIINFKLVKTFQLNFWMLLKKVKSQSLMTCFFSLFLINSCLYNNNQSLLNFDKVRCFTMDSQLIWLLNKKRWCWNFFYSCNRVLFIVQCIMMLSFQTTYLVLFKVYSFCTTLFPIFCLLAVIVMFLFTGSNNVCCDEGQRICHQ